MIEVLALIGLKASIFMLIGALIAWHFPQPFWAKIISAKVKELYEKVKEKILGMFS